MDLEDENESIFGELFGSPTTKKAARIISPNRPQQSATKIQDESSIQSESDDDFALPAATPSKPATDEGSSPAEAKQSTVDGESGSSAGAGAGTGASAGAPAKAKAEKADDETSDETADDETAAADGFDQTSSVGGLDQTKFEAFPQPNDQKDTFWDSITPEQLVWYQDYPAIVVPERLHFIAPCSKPQDGVMAYGPSAKNVQPARKRYVILNYFPVCLKCTHKPQTPYNTVGGQNVEKVLPYNTITKAGGATEQGPEDKWVDTDHHFKKVKSRTAGKSLTKKNWDVSMSHVHKFLARALERKAELAEQAQEEDRLMEEEEEEQRQEMEAAGAAAGADDDDDEGGEAGAGADTDADAAADAAAEPQSQPVVYEKGLPLAPGDRIVYWDRMKRTGAAGGRMEATISEIRSKKAAREASLVLLVLDNNQIVLDDWVIQRFVKDEETGEFFVAREGCMVKDHKLKKGKLEGSDPLKNDRMAALMSDFREDIKAYGAGDQLRSVGGGGGGSDNESCDDGPARSTEPQRKTTTKGKVKGRGKAEGKANDKGKDSAARKTGGGGGSSSSSVGSGRSGGGSTSTGRKALPSTEEDEGDAIAASIAQKKKTKRPGGDSSRQAGAKTHTTVKMKGAKKQEASAGKGGGRGAQKEEEEEATRQKSKNRKKRNEETAARKGAAGASKKKRNNGDGGGERGGENAPDPKRHHIDLTGADTGAGAGGVTGEPKVAKKRKTFYSSLISPVSDAAVQQGPKKKKPKKDGQQSKSQLLPGGGAGSAGGGDDSDAERKSATTTTAPAPKAFKAPKAPKAGLQKFKPPRRAETAGASDGPAQAVPEVDWRVPKKGGSSKGNGSAPAQRQQ